MVKMKKKANKIMAGGYALNILKLININVILDVLNSPFGYKSLGNFTKNSVSDIGLILSYQQRVLLRNWHNNSRFSLIGNNTFFKTAI